MGWFSCILTGLCIASAGAMGAGHVAELSWHPRFCRDLGFLSHCAARGSLFVGLLQREPELGNS